MQTVGQFDQYDPNIFCHGQKHLSQVLRLKFQLIGRIIQLTKFCDTIYQKGHLRTKFLRDLFICHDSIFHHIVKDTGHYGLLIHLQIRKDDTHTERVNNIWFSRFA